MSRASAVILAGLLISAAVAQPMWVKNGRRSGQAQAINLGSRCVAVTPAHVVQPEADRIRLTNVKGDAFVANLLAFNSVKDVALLLLDVPHSDVCQPFYMVSLARLDELHHGLVTMPGAWFDLVESPAGGLDRFDVALPKQLPALTDREFSVSEKEAPDPNPPTDAQGRTPSSWDRRSEAPEGRFKRMPMRGNSGAILWIGGGDSGHFTEGRYDGNQLRLVYYGLAAGMLLRVARDSAVLLSTSEIAEFIGQALRPVDASLLRIEPADILISDRGRGHGIGVTRDLGPSLLTDLSFEFDLGDEDIEFHGLKVRRDTGDDPMHRYDPHPQFRLAPHQSVDVVVSVSQFRPKDGRDWRTLSCKQYKWVPLQGTLASEQFLMDCELSQPVVARGIRVTLRGVPGRWRGLQLRLQK